MGTRMHPLSFDTPKPLMPLWNKPGIEHILNLLHDWGIREVLFNLHFSPAPIVRYLSEHKPAGIRLSFSFEPEILGTGGVLRRAEWFLSKEPFWMINSDIAADLSSVRLIHDFRRRKTIAALWVEPQHGPRTVEVCAGNVVNFQSSRPGSTGTYTFCGLQLISPAIFDFLPKESFFSIISVYQRAIKAGWRVKGTCAGNSCWADLGTPESYLKAHAEIRDCYRKKLPGRKLFDPSQERMAENLRKKGVFISGFAAIDRTAEIEPGARIENAVVWRGAHIGKNAVIENAVIGSNCEINGRVTRLAAKSGSTAKTAGSYFDPQLSIALQQLNLKPADATIIPFAPRGSARSFTRITGKGKSWIMIRYSLERTENSLYVQHARFLAKLGLNVPKIAADFPKQQFVLIQDLGDISLQQIADKSSRGELVRYYRHALNSIIKLHERGAIRALKEKLATVPPFSPDLYRWEREYFARQFLALHLHQGQSQIRGIMSELAEIGKTLSREKPVLIHRDLQSSNIIFFRGQPYFIDFQGMRFGPAAYDLASFLCDPYVSLPIDIQLCLLDYYNRHISTPRRQVAASTFWLAGIQRLAQALGAYGLLSANTETKWFAQYIPPALLMMRRALEQTGVCPRLYGII